MMLIVAAHDAFVSRVRGAFTPSDTHRIINNDVFSVCYDAAYTLVELADGQALMSGQGFCGNERISELKETTAERFSARIHEAVGFFTVVLISPRSVSIVSSLYRHRDVFYWEFRGDWFVSDDLAMLDLTAGPRSLNAGYVRDFVLDNLSSGSETIFDRVRQVELGTCVTFSAGLELERKIGNLPPASSQLLADVLVESIKRFASGKDRVIVRFSGGLDSSLILGAAKEALGRCEALHAIIPEEVQNSEVEIAQRVADQLRCELTVVHTNYTLSAKRNRFAASKIVTSPFDVYPYAHDATDRRDVFLEGVSSLDPERVLFLSGQGGDNVFVQNPPPFVIKDTLFAHGPLACAREAVKCSRLKSTSIIDVLRKAFAREVPNMACAERLIDVPGAEAHLMLQAWRRDSAKFSHLRSILEALQQYETSMEFGVASLHPLLLQNIVAFALNIEVRDLYTEVYDRIIQRQQLYARYNVDVAWRRTKKSSSTAVFLFFMNNKELIRDTLVGGIVARALRIDQRWLKNEISYNGSVTLTDSFGLIFNLLRLEIFCQQHSARLNC